MKQRIAEKSRQENFPYSRLPALSKAEIKLIKGSADFFGLNHYRTLLISNHEYPNTDPTSFIKDKGNTIEIILKVNNFGVL